MKTANVLAKPFNWFRPSIRWSVTLLVGMALALQSAQAQFTANYQTNIISGTTVNYGGTNYYVGYTNSYDELVIQNGGGLINYDGGMAGVYTSSNNLAIVTGAGSFWTNTGYLILSGEDYSYGPGPGNRLIITNGGTVYSYHGYIGNYVPGGVANDSALVTDPGSSWSMPGQFIVGDQSSGNSLMISNGGFVICSQGQVSGGVAVVTGAGSLWTNRSTFSASSGTTPSLIIQNGGQVADPGASAGSVWVSDPGSLWNNAGEVDISGSGTNFLVLTNGGAILASNLVIGLGTGQGGLIINGGSATVSALIATNGTNSFLEFDGGSVTAGMVLISNGPSFTLGDGVQSAMLEMTSPTNMIQDSVWIQTNATLSGCVTIGGSTLIDGTFVAGCGERCALMQGVTNNGTIQLMNGTELDIFGPLVNNGSIIASDGLVRYYSTFVNNGTVSGNFQDMQDVWTNSAGGKWENSLNWSQGEPTNVLSCFITNAGNKTVLLDDVSAAQTQTLSIVALTLNAPAGTTNTLSLINSGLATPLQAQFQFDIGAGGELSVSNGALTAGALYGQSLVDDGQVLMSAAELTVTNGLTAIGVNDAGSMSVSNSTVVSSDVALGNSLQGGGSLGIAGANSVWNARTFYLGQASSGNSFNLSGGEMSDIAGQIGCASGSSNDIALVSGLGALWSNATALVIGQTGPGNQLLIAAGGFVVSSNGVIGSSATAFGNSALVTGSGSEWSNAAAILIGSNGAANTLTINNGGIVSSAGQKPSASNVIGYASSGNSVLVSGAGSAWRVAGPLGVGQSGNGNNLIITNGGLVTSVTAAVGVSSNAVGNTILVTGSGSTWSNNVESFTVGVSGADNALIITNGGFVNNVGSGTLGNNAGSSNNFALVTGSGSYWTNSGALYIGMSGPANNLTIRNGGRVAGQTSDFLGYNAGSSNNTALVSDPGSTWAPGEQLVVGYSGSGNALVVDSNAQVIVAAWPHQGPIIGSTYLGYNAASSNNTLRVMNGAALQSINNIYVGYQGSSNSLIISGGSVTSSNNVIIGYANASACNNLLELDGGNLTVTNSATNAVLEVRYGTLVFNAGVLRVDELVITNPCAQFIHNGGTLIIGTNILNPNASSVGDGIPNWWKEQYGFDPLDPNVSAEDPDHDGANNLEEYLAGTNPTNAASVFHLTGIAATNAGVVVTWSTVGGHSYVVQTNNNFGPGAFRDLSSPISVGGTNAGTTNYLDSGAISNFPNRFYRVRLGP